MNYVKREQIAVGNYTYPLFSMEYFLDSMARMGIRNIELWAAGPHLYLEDLKFHDLQRLGHAIRSRALKAICLTPEQCVYPVNLGAEETHIRQRSLAYFEKALDVASELGIPAVVVTPGDGYREKECQADVWNYTVESLQRLSLSAGERDISLYLEHLTVETTVLAVHAAELEQLWTAVGSEHLHCMIDTDMMSRYGETPEDYLQMLGDQVRHVHFTDGMPGGHLVPGDGVLPMERYLQMLDAYRYSGYISLEILSDRYHLDPDTAIQRSLDWLTKRIT